MKLLQKGYNDIQALEVELRILEQTSAPPSRPRKLQYHNNNNNIELERLYRIVYITLICFYIIKHFKSFMYILTFLLYLFFYRWFQYLQHEHTSISFFPLHINSNDFRNKIHKINNKTNLQTWKTVCNENESIFIEKKNRK